MSLLGFLAAAAGTSALWIAGIIARDGLQRPDRRLGVSVALALAAWEFTAAFAYTAVDHRTFVFWMLLSYIPYVLFHALSFHYILVTWNKAGRTPAWITGVLYTAATTVAVVTLSRPDYFDTFYRSDGIWRFVHTPSDRGFLIVAVYTGLLQVLQLIIVLHQRRTAIRRVRARATVLIVALGLVFAGTILEAVVIPAITGMPGVGIQPILYIAWLLAIVIVLQEQRFQLPTLFGPDRAAIADNSGIILAYDGAVDAPIAVSAGARRAFGDAPPSFDRIEIESASRAIRLRTVEFLDPWHERVLTLVFGTQESGVRQFVLDHGLSRREEEVVRLLSAGISNRSIAELLYISERTVKVHVAAILRKSSLENRSQVIVAVHKRTD